MPYWSYCRMPEMVYAMFFLDSRLLRLPILMHNFKKSQSISVCLSSAWTRRAALRSFFPRPASPLCSRQRQTSVAFLPFSICTSKNCSSTFPYALTRAPAVRTSLRQQMHCVRMPFPKRPCRWIARSCSSYETISMTLSLWLARWSNRPQTWTSQAFKCDSNLNHWIFILDLLFRK